MLKHLYIYFLRKWPARKKFKLFLYNSLKFGHSLSWYLNIYIYIHR